LGLKVAPTYVKGKIMRKGARHIPLDTKPCKVLVIKEDSINTRTDKLNYYKKEDPGHILPAYVET
jgi:hypothetical protein